MIPVLDEALETVNEAFIQPRLRRFKARIALSLVTAGVLALFGLLGMICLFLLVFLALSRAYDPETAAGILFAFCIIVSIGALVVHLIARHALDREDIEARFIVPERRPMRRRDEAPAGPPFHEMVRDYFADHKGSALVAVAVAGMIFGARPSLAFKTIGWALRRKARRAMGD